MEKQGVFVRRDGVAIVLAKEVYPVANLAALARVLDVVAGTVRSTINK